MQGKELPAPSCLPQIRKKNWNNYFGIYCGFGGGTRHKPRRGFVGGGRKISRAKTNCMAHEVIVTSAATAPQVIKYSFKHGHTFNFHAPPKRQSTRPKCAASGQIPGKIFKIDLVHFRPFTHVCQHHCDLDDMLKR